MTDYLATVIGHRCGIKRTFTVASAWIDVVVAAAVATKLKPTTNDTQYATVMVAAREAPDAPWGQVRYELGTTVDYPLPQEPGAQPPAEAASPEAAAPVAVVSLPATPNAPEVIGTVAAIAHGRVAAFTWQFNADQEPDPQPGHYYVTAEDGDRHWHVYGPLPTHTEALAAVADVKTYANERDPRAHFMGWGTGRIDLTDEPVQALISPKVLAEARARWAAKAALLEAMPKAHARKPRNDVSLTPDAQPAVGGSLQTFAAASRKPARPRKARKGTAGPGSAQDASQGQPGAADEATPDPDKQAGGLPVGSDG